ncbi:hypothetical protein BD311DRAFT_759666 [Dichomitus squalens]|uniref:Uncharacterized protein n=1 Tax=Dichomitus squalens TaxID=114155 RepID=A0A4V2K072_9APHY|nr:hypothetical protein BD311DRAFT_759666 [Dichomitus squalens]
MHAHHHRLVSTSLCDIPPASPSSRYLAHFRDRSRAMSEKGMGALAEQFERFDIYLRGC